MILDLVLWSGVFGSGYAVFKRQDKLFEPRVLKEQKRRTSVLKARLLGEQAQREQDHSDAKAGPDMKEDILIKDGRSLELLSKVDTIVFDKTGKLTQETPGIGTIHVLAQGSSADDILAQAAAAEHRQTHPLARAILGAAAAWGLTVRVPEQSEYRLGYGVRARLRGGTVTIGSARFMGAEGIALPEGLDPVLEQCEEQGHGVLLVARAGAIELQPALRPEAAATIAALRGLPGIREIRILSGDRERPPRARAEKLGMDAHDSQVLPEQKAALIERLQQEGRFVCFVGDGVNDAIAMKQAQVSISLQGASQLATDTAQIVLMNKDIRHLPRLLDLSAGFKRHMNEQFMLILTPSLLGAGLILLSGWGMVYIMYMRMAALGASLGNAMLERPPPQCHCRSRPARPPAETPAPEQDARSAGKTTAVPSGPERTRTCAASSDQKSIAPPSRKLTCTMRAACPSTAISLRWRTLPSMRRFRSGTSRAAPALPPMRWRLRLAAGCSALTVPPRIWWSLAT